MIAHHYICAWRWDCPTFTCYAYYCACGYPLALVSEAVMGGDCLAEIADYHRRHVRDVLLAETPGTTEFGFSILDPTTTLLRRALDTDKRLRAQEEGKP